MQGPLFQKIQLKENESFNILKVNRPYFVVPWHFHPEIEIMLVTHGSGTRFVGDSIESFEAGDLVIVGSNLAHVWKNGPQHYDLPSNFLAEARVILFNQNCFGSNFFNIPEMKGIKNLLVKATRGIKFYGRTKRLVSQRIIQAYHQNELKRFVSLIDILNELSTSNEYTLLTSIGYSQNINETDLQRLNTVLDYIMKNFREEIKLEGISNMANMVPTAFCRYFKSRTNKTVFQFINELRVGYAHKMLVETQLNITQISYESGFNNLSNFYSQFNKLTGKSPFKFRREHDKKQLRTNATLL